MCQDAGRTVPTAMIGSYLLSGVRHRRHRRRSQPPDRLSVPLRFPKRFQHGGCQCADGDRNLLDLRRHFVIQPVFFKADVGCKLWSSRLNQDMY
jgi:hypothetical protein